MFSLIIFQAVKMLFISCSVRFPISYQPFQTPVARKQYGNRIFIWPIKLKISKMPNSVALFEYTWHLLSEYQRVMWCEQWSPRWLGCKRDEILPSYRDYNNLLFWGRFLKHLLNGAYKDGNLVIYLSHKKRAPGWLGYIGDEKLPSYIYIYRDFNKP